jgi:hypothetical protein
MPRPSGPPLPVIDAVRAVDRGLTALQRKLAPPPIPLLEIVTATWRAHALGALARLGVADVLAGGPRPVDEIARAVGADEDSLYRVLRALASDGILAQPEPRTFGLNAVSDPLRADHPQSVRHSVIQMTSAWNQRAWLDLETTVRDGAPAFARVFGKDLWAYFEDHPEEGQHFHRSMREFTRLDVPLIAAAHDFGVYRSVVDVGGGAGQLLAGLLAAYPSLRGVVYDLAGSVVETRDTLRAAGVEDRAEVQIGSYFDAVPPGHDAYLLRQIVHGHAAGDLARILGNVRAAMKPSSKLLVLETLVPGPEDRWPNPSFLDLQMLVGSGGRERTREEMGALFAASGIQLADVVRTAAPTAVYVGVPA